METKANQLAAELHETGQQLEQNKNKLSLEQKILRDKESELQTLNKFLDESKAKNKSLLTQIAELEMLLANEKERNSKNVELIEQE